MDLSETVVPDVSVDREELTKFCKSFASISWSRNFLNIFVHISRDDVFSVVWLISLEKLIGSSRKFYHKCISILGSWLIDWLIVALRSGSDPGADSVSVLRMQTWTEMNSRWWRFVYCECCWFASAWLRRLWAGDGAVIAGLVVIQFMSVSRLYHC